MSKSVEGQIFCVVGDLVEDVVLSSATLPDPGGQAEVDIAHHLGGSAASIAVQFAALGGRSRLVARVGDDSRGERLTCELARSQVEPMVFRRGVTPTVIALIHDSGERSFFASTTAARGEPISVPEVLQQLDDITWLHVSGYWLTNGTQIIHEISRLGLAAKQKNVGVSMDLGSASRISELGSEWVHEAISELLPEVILGNDVEFRALGARSYAAPTIQVITDGGCSVRVVSSTGQTEMYVLRRKRVTNSLGAGDAFAAGFLKRYVAARDPLAECVAAAHAAALAHLQEQRAIAAEP